MRELTQVEFDRVAEAIVVWTGKDTQAWPQPDDDRLVGRFGEEIAAELMPLVRELYEEFYVSD